MGMQFFIGGSDADELAEVLPYTVQIARCFRCQAEGWESQFLLVPSRRSGAVNRKNSWIIHVR